LMFLDELCKRLVTALLSLENPGKFVVHSRSLYLLYATRRKKLQPAPPASGTLPKFAIGYQYDYTKYNTNLERQGGANDYAIQRFAPDQGSVAISQAHPPGEQTGWH